MGLRRGKTNLGSETANAFIHGNPESPRGPAINGGTASATSVNRERDQDKERKASLMLLDTRSERSVRRRGNI